MYAAKGKSLLRVWERQGVCTFRSPEVESGLDEQAGANPTLASPDEARHGECCHREKNVGGSDQKVLGAGVRDLGRR